MQPLIKYLVMSDIHLGHNINRTDFIVANLRQFFKSNHKQLKELDMIIIAGDIFDKLLISSSDTYLLATEWLTELILYCKTHHIILRILEGTPSHDWQQSKLISNIITKLNIDIDYKYINTLTIEHIPTLDIHILFIPDEYKIQASDTYQEVLDLLRQHKISQVDIAILHGQFNYQLPMVKLPSSHDEDNYLNIVKHYISIGHIHTFSVYDRIIAQGSFDRLAHNEEEDKGCVYITLDTKLGNSFKFLVNKNSMVFKTYTYDKDTTLDQILLHLDQELPKYTTGSNIRIISHNEEFLNKNTTELNKRYGHVNIKVDKPKVTTSSKYTIIEDTIHIDGFNITSDNIQELLQQELTKHNLTPQDMKIFKTEINKVV